MSGDLLSAGIFGASLLAAIAAIIKVLHDLIASVTANTLAAAQLAASLDVFSKLESRPCTAVMPHVFSLDAAAVYLGLTPTELLALEQKGRVRRVPRSDPPKFTRKALDEPF